MATRKAKKAKKGKILRKAKKLEATKPLIGIGTTRDRTIHS
jgi:hypothetical protein